MNKFIRAVEKEKTTLKQNILSKYFKEYFPMACEDAVAVSRHISNQVNKEDNKLLEHLYDKGRASTGDKFKTFVKVREKLLKLWEQHFPTRSIDNLVNDWYINFCDNLDNVIPINQTEEEVEVIG